MPEEYLQNWDHFQIISDKYKSSQKIFRGQAVKDWPLIPTLARIFRENKIGQRTAIKIESEVLHWFQDNNKDQYLQKLNPKNLIMWWTIMQHYGVPTRLLDWTKDINVALYFAVSSNFNCDGALYFFDDGHLNFVRNIRTRRGVEWPDFDLQLAKSISGEKYEKSVYAFTIDLPLDRMKNQQACYTISTEITEDVESFHDNIANKLMFDGVHGAENSSVVFRYLIKNSSKLDFLDQLRKIGVTGQTLFTGIDGQVKSTIDFLHTTMIDRK